LGVLLSAKGRAAEARKAFETARQGLEQQAADRADSSRAGFKHVLARFLAACPDPGLRDAARAARMASDACQQSTEMGKYSSTLGLAQYRAGDWPAAAQALEKADGLLCGQDDALNRLLLAMAYERLGKKVEAR